MGRKIKRVPLDFSWPLQKVWEGYLNPHYKYCKDCPFCEGTGLNEASKRIKNDWYDYFNQTGRRWCDKLTQDEVETLMREGRLWDDFNTDRSFLDKESGLWKRYDPQTKLLIECSPPEIPSAEAVNEWSRGGMGHDEINQGICVEVRCKRLGIWGQCDYCEGKGEVWRSLGDKEAADAWTKTEPPEGEGWQVWETVTEGSPISPVFEFPEGLIDWLVNSEGYSRVAATNFVLNTQWAPSMVLSKNNFYQDIESAVL